MDRVGNRATGGHLARADRPTLGRLWRGGRLPLSEADLAAPVNAYGAAKLAMDDACTA